MEDDGWTVKRRWQTFAQRCGLCGGHRVLVLARALAIIGQPLRAFRLCIRCDR